MSADAPSERWRRIEELLGAALERAPDERDAFLAAACADDAALRAEVASLLAAHERSGLVDRLAGDLAPLAARLRDGATLVGRDVGRYRVVEHVGGGGMGVVYKALDERLGRTVALKFVQSRFGPDDSAAARFRLEARAVAALEHPNICTVHEIGETEDGRLYLVMPLYDGQTLHERILARAPLPIGEAVGLAAQIARGLAKAHARGIVHRDVKPSNVFVTDDGVVKILDFGIAKLADVTITGAGGPLGTAAYMSPEQARGEPVDHRTDLWSLGVVLYEMLTGRRPFDGLEAALYDASQRATPTPPSALRPGVPAALDRIVATALARSRDARFESAATFEGELLALGVATGLPAGGSSVSGERATRARGAADVGRRRWRAGAAGGVLAAALGVAAWLGVPRLRGAPARGVPPTVAVLPFVDGSPRHDEEYFSDGMTEELIATLARVDGLRVASRTSAFAYKNRGMDVREVGARLGVATVLEGSVRRAGDRLRISAQLVSVADGYPLWADTYDRAVGDAFAVQQEIARAIAQTLRVKLVGPGRGGAPEAAPDARAYDQYLQGRHALYLKGRYAWYRRTEEGLRTAVEHFERAVALDPTYARAHAGLADAYAVLGFYDYLRPHEAFPKAEAAAARAAALDPTLAAPLATAGYVALYHRWDLARAEESFRRAIALDPNYSTAHQWYANLLTAAGRFGEAEREMRRAQEIDPLSLIANAALGWVLYHAGDHRAAVAQCDRTLELNPEYAIAHLWRGWALQELDSLPAAIAAHRRALAASDSSGLYVASLAAALARGGGRLEAAALLARLLARDRAGRYVPAYEVAKVHAALGDRDAAFAMLDRAIAERAHSLVFLDVDPQLASLRDDARYARLRARVFPPDRSMR